MVTQLRYSIQLKCVVFITCVKLSWSQNTTQVTCVNGAGYSHGEAAVSKLSCESIHLFLLSHQLNPKSCFTPAQSLQVTTLQSVLENMTVEEMEDTLIIIFIAETDPDSVFQISSDVQKQFHQVMKPVQL